MSSSECNCPPDAEEHHPLCFKAAAPQWLGKRVRKIKGLPFGKSDAVVVADYGEGAGRRIVVKHPEGWQHIFSPDQLEVVSAAPQPSEDEVERVAKALYGRNPLYDQECDLDGRPISGPYRIAWDDLIEFSPGYREDILEDARAAIAALSRPDEQMRKALELLGKALPFLGSAACRSQIICGVDAGELYFEIEEALSTLKEPS